MIWVNRHKFQCEHGQTVAALLNQLKNSGEQIAFIINPNITVIINQQIIPQNEYQSRIVNEGDQISVYPLLTGG